MDKLIKHLQSLTWNTKGKYLCVAINYYNKRITGYYLYYQGDIQVYDISATQELAKQQYIGNLIYDNTGYLPIQNDLAFLSMPNCSLENLIIFDNGVLVQNSNIVVPPCIEPDAVSKLLTITFDSDEDMFVRQYFALAKIREDFTNKRFANVYMLDDKELYKSWEPLVDLHMDQRLVMASSGLYSKDYVKRERAPELHREGSSKMCPVLSLKNDLALRDDITRVPTNVDILDMQASDSIRTIILPMSMAHSLRVARYHQGSNSYYKQHIHAIVIQEGTVCLTARSISFLANDYKADYLFLPSTLRYIDKDAIFNIEISNPIKIPAGVVAMADPISNKDSNLATLEMPEYSNITKWANTFLDKNYTDILYLGITDETKEPQTLTERINNG